MATNYIERGKTYIDGNVPLSGCRLIDFSYSVQISMINLNPNRFLTLQLQFESISMKK
jgi:hypothetical protein